VHVAHELKPHTWISGRLSWGAVLLALLLSIFGVGIYLHTLTNPKSVPIHLE
jgi:hypothetical protein